MSRCAEGPQCPCTDCREAFEMARARRVRDAEDRELAEVAPRPEDTCQICRLPFSPALGTTRVGVGDGSGQRFAHEVCYWRDRAKRLEAWRERVLRATAAEA